MIPERRAQRCKSENRHFPGFLEFRVQPGVILRISIISIIIDSTDPIGPGAALFTPSFYANCRRCLTPQGILITQNGVPFIQGEELTSSAQAFRRLFAYPKFYFAAVPMYIGGSMAFGCASQKTDASAVPSDVLAQRMKDRHLRFRYYSPGVHLAAFAMPPYVRDLTT